MPEYLAPGVYVEEISTGAIPIAGVSTSTAGFVGVTRRGPTDPRMVTSPRQFERLYGGLTDPSVSYLPYAVRGFFENGGRRLFVARVVGANAVTAGIQLQGAAKTIQLQALGAGEMTRRIWIRVMAASRRDPANPIQPDPGRFRIQIAYYEVQPPDGALVDPTDPKKLRERNRREPEQFEDWDDLSGDPNLPDYVLSRLQNSDLVTPVQQNPALDIGPIAVRDWAPLEGGTDVPLSTASYTGDTDPPKGLKALEQIDEISLLCVPDETTFGNDDIRNALIDQCERLGDRFAIMQVATNQRNVDAIKPTFSSSYAAMYYPWLRVSDPRTSNTLLVPPGGHITGVYAGTDVRLGVHEAPANVELRGIVTNDLPGNRKPLEYTIGRDEQALLNPRGINVCRDFRVDRRGIPLIETRFLPPGESTFYFAENVDFVPEAGQSISTANQRVIERLANHIVDQMEARW